MTSNATHLPFITFRSYIPFLSAFSSIVSFIEQFSRYGRTMNSFLHTNSCLFRIQLLQEIMKKLINKNN
ncbi:hypothetical protein Lalb_Chr09g0329671 [Lupinus albus]|uniref:Uncharacterized protein n=1 Tax=Lupinus albus TaxID=3870 RepID=A0A6A4Q0D0_LUPAL|nr:hypothetical protein Lalb_Chr09g0329671 [Lupinus albus]